MKSQIFYSRKYKVIEGKIKYFLNKGHKILSSATASSTRAVGDAIEYLLSENFSEIIGVLAKNISTEFARRAMADIAFTDHNDLYYIVDVKTHRIDTQFNMPNLTSVERLVRFYEDDTNYFTVIIVKYQIIRTTFEVLKVHFVPIEFLSWECLTIGALGWGQIQIANANNIIINHGYSRKKWMLELCNKILSSFYLQEIKKIEERIDYFKEVREKWRKKPDIWE